jgi:hypothetical protein
MFVNYAAEYRLWVTQWLGLLVNTSLQNMEEVEMYEEVLLSLVDNELTKAGAWSIPNLTLSLPEIEPCFVGYPAYNLVTILTELFRLLYCR